jgi:hypothetical protein
MQTIQEGRQGNERAWVLPRTSKFYQGIYGLVARVHGQCIPLGTAFCFSRLGFIATAMHNCWEALKLDWRGRAARTRYELPKKVDLAEVSLSVLWQRYAEGRSDVMLWPLETAEAPMPTDLALGFATFQSSHPYLPLPISFALPARGDLLYCIGCIDTRGNATSFNESDIKDGAILDKYQPDLHVIDARASTVFTHRFARGFVDGPCFLVDADLPHGMSGGPVIDERGLVRGIVTAGAAEICGASSSIVSLLYPAFLSPVTFGIQLGPLRLNASRPLFELIGRGFITTDGSETAVTMEHGADGWTLGILHPRAERKHVFDDLAGLQRGLGATAHDGVHYRMKYPDSE